jgi:hypothetical protein
MSSVEISEPFHDGIGILHHAGNGRLCQEIKTRLPGR